MFDELTPAPHLKHEDLTIDTQSVHSPKSQFTQIEPGPYAHTSHQTQPEESRHVPLNPKDANKSMPGMLS